MSSALKIAIIGASGNIGSRLANEALARGHTVTGIVRHPQALISNPKIIAKEGDIRHAVSMAENLSGHDVVISAIKFQGSSVQDLLKAVRDSGVKRLLVVGGAGSLEVAPGKQLIDTPEFPEAYRPEASAGRDWLNSLKKEKTLSWSFLSPSAMIAPGVRTGKFRLGKDQLLVAENGESSISIEDFAVAMLDEVEKPQHERERFTVGY